MFLTANQAIAERLKKLSANGDPLARLNEIMDWELFIFHCWNVLLKRRGKVWQEALSFASHVQGVNFAMLI